MKTHFDPVTQQTIYIGTIVQVLDSHHPQGEVAAVVVDMAPETSHLSLRKFEPSGVSSIMIGVPPVGVDNQVGESRGGDPKHTVNWRAIPKPPAMAEFAVSDFVAGLEPLVTAAVQVAIEDLKPKSS